MNKDAPGEEPSSRSCLACSNNQIHLEKIVKNVPLEPALALAAGLVILIYPKSLNYVVAAYLIVTGGSRLLKQPL